MRQDPIVKDEMNEMDSATCHAYCARLNRIIVPGYSSWLQFETSPNFWTYVKLANVVVIANSRSLQRGY